MEQVEPITAHRTAHHSCVQDARPSHRFNGETADDTERSCTDSVNKHNITNNNNEPVKPCGRARAIRPHAL